MKKSEFGQRLKDLEALADIKLMRNLPVIVRIDGNRFSRWTSGLNKPYDKRFMDLMDATTKFLIEKTHAILGFTQSDEISLLLYNYQKPKTDIYFDGRVNKLNSVISSMSAAYFNSKVAEFIPEKASKLAFFDCRSFAVPSETEAINTLIWRQADATVNAIQLLGQAHFSQKELYKKSCNDIQEMLFQTHGINFNDEPARFKRGGFFHKVLEEKMLPSHNPSKNGEMELSTRSSIQTWDLPQLTKIENRVDVIFYGAEPILRQEQNG